MLQLKDYPARHKLALAEDVINHPAFPTAVWDLEPTQEGYLRVAEGRTSGPFTMYWQTHGDGPIKVLLICGIAARRTAWQRQTLHFGHIHGGKYTVLLVDNRGVGESDKPFWYSTSEMAKDLIEVIDHVGWTQPRQVHIVGLSMGGMIAQEMAVLIPERIRTLNLIHTAAKMEASWGEYVEVYTKFLKARTLDETLQDSAIQMFRHKWLFEPDDATVPTRDMPNVRMPPGGEYLMFNTNYERYVAQEMTKQRNPNYSDAERLAVLGHFIACSFHQKSEAQLRKMADAVGRERILVLHTIEDHMIRAEFGAKLMRILRPETALMMGGQGHVPKLEKAAWFNRLLEESFAKGEMLLNTEKS